MKNLTDIKYRMKTVSDTKQITNAMETISVAKMRKANEKYEKNQTYFKKLRETINDIVLHTSTVSHRYLSDKKGDRAVFIVIASDKGLAGGFNHNVLTHAWEKMKDYSNCNIFTVGQMAREFFEKKNLIIDGEFIDVSINPTMRDARNIVNSIIQLYDKDMMDEVYIVYTRMENSLSMYPETIKLLPLSREEMMKEVKKVSVDEEYYLAELEYEPSSEEVLNELIPQYLAGMIYGALVQSVASEHLSRRAAMSNATKNASEVLDELKVEYNRARQESVTNELVEIITSSMGVK